MIAALTGTLVSKHPQSLIVDVHGVGYEVLTSLQTYYHLPEPKESVSFHIYTHVREDVLHLYGFMSREEKAAFVLLLSVSGVGPRLALALLSGLTVRELATAIGDENTRKLCTVPGVGNKTAARLILELKDKVSGLWLMETTAPGATTDPGTVRFPVDDALSALVNLGYQPAVAKDVLRQIEQSMSSEHANEGVKVEDVLREALKRLSK